MQTRIGSQTSGKAHQNIPTSHLQASLADVALIDAKTASAAGSMSVSWWHEKVATGVAPPPAFRAPRCTRWRLSDVTKFWREFADRTASPDADRVMAQAKLASAAATAQRAAQAGA